MNILRLLFFSKKGKKKGLLDLYNNAIAGFSFRKLRANQINCVELRRDNDDATTIVYLEKEGSITLNSIVSTGGILGDWVTSNNAFIVTWYNQLGNNNNYTQLTTTLQAQLIVSGVINLLNGKPAILHTLTRKNLASSSFFNFTNDLNKSIFLVANTVNNTIRQRILTFATNTVSNLGLWFEAGAGIVSFFTNGYANRVEITTVKTSQVLVTGIDASGNQSIFANGVSGGTNALGATINTTNKNGLGSMVASTSDPLDGNIQELILFNDDKSSDRESIELDINTYYSIY